MALIDTLKQIILDVVRDSETLYCPSEHGLEEIEACRGGNAVTCRQCWAAAIAKAEQEEAMSNESD